MELSFIHRVLIEVLKVSIAYRNGGRYECNWLKYSTSLVYVSREVGHITKIVSHGIYINIIDMQRYININAWMDLNQIMYIY